MNKIEINGNGVHLILEILDYENKSTSDVSDANWLKCRVNFKSDSFSGSIATTFTTVDFLDFYRSIKNLLSGSSNEASFLTDEEQIELIILQNKTGTLSIKGKLYDYPGSSNFLSFQYSIDFSVLIQVAENLEEAVNNFPMKGNLAG